MIPEESESIKNKSETIILKENKNSRDRNRNSNTKLLNTYQDSNIKNAYINIKNANYFKYLSFENIYHKSLDNILLLIVFLWISNTILFVFDIFILDDLESYKTSIKSSLYNINSKNIYIPKFKIVVISIYLILNSVLFLVLSVFIKNNFYFKEEDYKYITQRINFLVLLTYILQIAVLSFSFIINIITLSDFPIMLYQLKYLSNNGIYIFSYCFISLIANKMLIKLFIFNEENIHDLFYFMVLDFLLLILNLIFSLFNVYFSYREVALFSIFIIMFNYTQYFELKHFNLLFNNYKKYKKIHESKIKSKAKIKYKEPRRSINNNKSDVFLLKPEEEKSYLLSKENVPTSGNNKAIKSIMKKSSIRTRPSNKSVVSYNDTVVEYTSNYQSIALANDNVYVKKSIINKDDNKSKVQIRDSLDTHMKNKNISKIKEIEKLYSSENISPHKEGQKIFSFKDFKEQLSHPQDSKDKSKDLYKDYNKEILDNLKITTNNSYKLVKFSGNRTDSEQYLNQIEVGRVIINNFFEIEFYNTFFEQIFGKLIVNTTIGSKSKKVAKPTNKEKETPQKKRTSSVIKLKPMMFNTTTSISNSSMIKNVDYLKKNINNKNANLNEEKQDNKINNNISVISSNSFSSKSYEKSINILHSNHHSSSTESKNKNNYSIKSKTSSYSSSNTIKNTNKNNQYLKSPTKHNSNKSKLSMTSKKSKIKKSFSIKLKIDYASDYDIKSTKNLSMRDSKLNFICNKYFKADEIIKLETNSKDVINSGTTNSNPKNYNRNNYKNTKSNFLGNKLKIKDYDDKDNFHKENLNQILIKEFINTAPPISVFNASIYPPRKKSSTHQIKLSLDEPKLDLLNKKNSNVDMLKLGTFEYQEMLYIVFLRKLDINNITGEFGNISGFKSTQKINKLSKSIKSHSLKNINSGKNSNKSLTKNYYELIFKSTIEMNQILRSSNNVYIFAEKLTTINNLMLSKLSHEIKTPLIGIQNLCDILGNLKINNPGNTPDAQYNSIISQPLKTNSVINANIISQDGNLEKIRYLCEIVLIMINDVSIYLNSELVKNEKYHTDKDHLNSFNCNINNSIKTYNKEKIFNFDSDSRSLALASNKSLKYNLNTIGIDLSELNNYIESLSKGLLIIYSKENCSIITKFDNDLFNQKICIDESKLKQLLFNIISNAIKNTDYGKIKISFIKANKRNDSFSKTNSANNITQYISENNTSTLQLYNKSKLRNNKTGNTNTKSYFNKISPRKPSAMGNSSKSLFKINSSSKYNIDELSIKNEEEKIIDRYKKRRISITKLNSLKFQGIRDYNVVVVDKNNRKKYNSPKKGLLNKNNENISYFKCKKNTFNSPNKECNENVASPQQEKLRSSIIEEQDKMILNRRFLSNALPKIKTSGLRKFASDLSNNQSNKMTLKLKNQVKSTSNILDIKKTKTIKTTKTLNSQILSPINSGSINSPIYGDKKNSSFINFNNVNETRNTIYNLNNNEFKYALPHKMKEESSDSSQSDTLENVNSQNFNLLIKIEDCGPGISSDLLMKIKDKNSLTNFDEILTKNDKYEEKKGFGIGLIIIKKLSDQLGIKLDCSNKLKRRFTDISIRKDNKNKENTAISAGAVFTLSFSHALIKECSIYEINKSINNPNSSFNINKSSQALYNNKNTNTDLIYINSKTNNVEIVENNKKPIFDVCKIRKELLLSNKHDLTLNKYNTRSQFFLFRNTNIFKFNELQMRERRLFQSDNLTNSVSLEKQKSLEFKYLRNKNVSKYSLNNLSKNTPTLKIPTIYNNSIDLIKNQSFKLNSKSIAPIIKFEKNSNKSNDSLYSFNFNKNSSIIQNNLSQNKIISLILKNTDVIREFKNNAIKTLGKKSIPKNGKSNTSNLNEIKKNDDIDNKNSINELYLRLNKQSYSLSPQRHRFSINIPNSELKEYNYFPSNINDYIKINNQISKSIKIDVTSDNISKSSNLINPYELKNIKSTSTFISKNLSKSNNKSLNFNGKSYLHSPILNTIIEKDNINLKNFNNINNSISKFDLSYKAEINIQKHSKSTNNLPNNVKIPEESATSLKRMVIDLFSQLDIALLNINAKNKKDDDNEEDDAKLAQSYITCIKSEYILISIIYPKTKKIIIIDDNIPILNAEAKLCSNLLIKKKLDSKFKILTYHDGIEALYAIYRDVTIGESSIKLIISDEMMNYMNGSEMFNLISKKIFSNKKIPFVICSAFSNDGHFQKMKDLNIETFKKPLNKGNVEYLLEKYCGIKNN